MSRYSIHHSKESSVPCLYLLCFEKKYGTMAKVEIYKVLRFWPGSAKHKLGIPLSLFSEPTVGDEAAKISAHDAMPCCSGS